MAKTNRPGSDDSGFIRRTLAAASLMTALSGAANAQGNKAPDMPDSESEKVVLTVKDKTGVQLANELGLNFSDEDLRRINSSGNDFSQKGPGYASSKPASKKPVQLAPEPINAYNPSGPVPSVRPVPQFSFATDSGERIGASFDPASGQAAANIESAGKYRADFGLIRDMGTIKDTRLKASFQALYAASKLGTYIGIEKGSELSKFVVAQGFKVEGGKLQVTAALLKKVVEVNFTEPDVDVTKRPELTQKAIGIDYTRGGFSRESLLQEIKTSVVYYDVDGKNLGTIGHIVTDNAAMFDQTRVDGGVRGGKKLLAEMGLVLKITETLRADVSLGAEHIRYDAMFDTPAKSKTGATGSVGLAYQPTPYDRVSVKGRASSTSKGVDLKYEHDFGKGVSGFIEAGRTAYSTGIQPETRIMAGVNIAMDPVKGRASKLSPLFTDWSKKTELTLADLNPNPLVATDTIQVMERVIYKEHEIRIDKTVLPGTSFLEKNPDGTLKALDIDTGAGNLVSISSSNLPAPYSGYLSVSGGRYLRFANLEQFSKIAPFVANVSIADNVGTFTLVSVNIKKGSADLSTTIERTSGASGADAAAFVAGIKTISQIVAGSGNTAPTLSDVVAQTIAEDGTVTVNVTVGDTQTAAGSLTLSASSSNTTLFPSGSIVLGGSGANRTIALTPAANASGTATISYVVTDGGGLSVNKTFLVTVNAADDAPVFGSAQGNLSLTQSSAMANVTAPLATDVDSGTLTYSMTGLPAGLSFNPSTRVISGTPTGTGTSTVTYGVTDGTNTVTQNFQIAVAAAHVPPVMGDVPNQSASTGTAFTLNLSGYVTLTNGDAITGYSLASGALPPGLWLNPSTGAITGTPTTVGTYNVTVLATDADGNSNADAITFTVIDGVAPNAPTITAGYNATTAANSENVEVNGEIGATVWVNGTNVATIGGTGKVTVSLDTSGADGAKNFSIVLKDAQNNPSTAANVTITADRTAPSVVSMPSSGVSHNAATVTFTIGETGTGYYLVQAGGGAPSVGTVVSSGTPVSLTANVGQAVSLSGLSAATAYDVYFVTKDALGNTSLSVSTVSFTTSAAPNTAPTISTAPTNQTTGKNTSSAVGMTVADTESGAAAVTVTATSSNQSIVKDANVVVSAGAGGSRTITVTPEAGATGTVTINYVATDGGGLTANGSYTVTFTNAAPVISASVSNQSYDQNAAISALTLPAATDADVGETVTYSVSALPAGLSFNSGTRQITGTPTGTGTTTVTYTATDASGATDTKTFDIVVSANVAPVMSGGAIGLSSGLNVTIAATPLNISDTGPMTVTFVADNGGRYNITGASGGSVSNNNSSSVTITGATTGAITFTFTPPSTDTNGIGGESSTITVTDSGGLSTSLNDFVFY